MSDTGTLSSTNGPAPHGRSRGRPFIGGMFAVMLLVAAWYWLAPAYTRYQADSLIADAHRLIELGQLTSAESKLERLLGADPSHATALMTLANLKNKMGDAPRATSLYRQIPESSRHYRSAHLQLSFMLLKSGEIDLAEQELITHLQRYPDETTARTELRWLYFNQFRTRPAIDLLLDQLRRDPDDLTVLPEILDTEFRVQIPQEILSHFEKMQREHPRQVAFNRALGICRWKMGDFDEARDLFQTALSLRPDDVETRLTASRFLIEQLNVDAARELLSTPGSDDQSPSDSLAAMQLDDRYWSLLSLIADANNDTVHSLEYLNRALAIRPWNIEYLTRKTQALRLNASRDPLSTAPTTAAPDEQHPTPDQITDPRQMADLTDSISRARREIEHLVEQGYHRQPNLNHAQRFAELCQKLGRLDEAQGWHQISQRLEIIDKQRHRVGQ